MVFVAICIIIIVDWFLVHTSIWSNYIDAELLDVTVKQHVNHIVAYTTEKENLVTLD